MKKVLAFLLVLALVAGAYFGITFLRSPEYALLQMVEDVQEGGMDALELHLTPNGLETLDTITNLANNPLVAGLAGLLGQTDMGSDVMTKLQNMEFELVDILEGKNQATVIVAFQYDAEISGTLELTMLRTADGWKIDGLSLPQLDQQ